MKHRRNRCRLETHQCPTGTVRTGTVSYGDLVDDEDEGLAGLQPGLRAEPKEETLPEDQAAVLIGPEPLDEVLVAVGLMELDELDLGART